MVSPDTWNVGAVMEDGRKRILSNGAGPNPSRIRSIIFPISFPWSNGPELREADYNKVIGKGDGADDQVLYSARLEDRVPNSDSDLWEIELEVWEHPPNMFNYSELTHSDNISYAHWDEEDLLDAIKG